MQGSKKEVSELNAEIVMKKEIGLHKKWRGNHTVNSFDSEVVGGEYLPSDAETEIDDLQISGNSNGIEGNDVNTRQVTNGSTITATDYWQASWSHRG